jgi:hypothetical protein
VKFVLKNRKTPRFEVGYQERLEQSRTASNAVRMPRLGYALYRVYDIEERKEVSVPNFNGTYIKSGPVYNTTRQYNSGSWVQDLWALIDELESRSEPAYDVRWLKPKHATVLRMKGHRVEPAAQGEQPGRVNPQPVRLGA